MEKLLHKNILILHLVTIGLPKKKRGGIHIESYYDFKDNSKYDESRIIQISWIYIENLTTDTLKYEKIKTLLRKIDSEIPITNSEMHGITHVELKQNGLTLSEILKNTDLQTAIKNCDYVLSHGTAFNLCILANELYREKLNDNLMDLCKIIKENKFLCTAELGQDECKIMSQYMSYKIPKLSELYHHYYKTQPEIKSSKNNIECLIDIIKINLKK